MTTQKFLPVAALLTLGTRRSDLGPNALPRGVHAPAAPMLNLVCAPMTQKMNTHRAATTGQMGVLGEPVLETTLTTWEPRAVHPTAGVCVKSLYPKYTATIPKGRVGYRKTHINVEPPEKIRLRLSVPSLTDGVVPSVRRKNAV